MISAKVRVQRASSGMVLSTNPDAMMKQILKLEREKHAAVIADVVTSAFNTLLFESPQRYGTYVSNWRVRVGSKDSNTLEYSMFSEIEKPWYKAGDAPAISAARAANPDIYDKLASFSMNTRATFPSIYVYNNTPHSAVPEEGPLRAANMAVTSPGSFERFEQTMKDFSSMSRKTIMTYW